MQIAQIKLILGAKVVAGIPVKIKSLAIVGVTLTDILHLTIKGLKSCSS